MVNRYQKLVNWIVQCIFEQYNSFNKFFRSLLLQKIHIIRKIPTDHHYYFLTFISRHFTHFHLFFTFNLEKKTLLHSTNKFYIDDLTINICSSGNFACKIICDPLHDAHNYPILVILFPVENSS